MEDSSISFLQFILALALGSVVGFCSVHRMGRLAPLTLIWWIVNVCALVFVIVWVLVFIFTPMQPSPPIEQLLVFFSMKKCDTRKYSETNRRKQEIREELN